MVLSAAAVAVAAFTGWHLPTPVTVVAIPTLLMLAATLGRSRSSVLLLAATILFAGQHAAMSLDALRAPLPTVVEGTGRLISDPVIRQFDTQVIVDVDGRRFQASVPLESAAQLRTMLTGEYVQISGRTQLLQGAPEGWVLSWHLAGRLRVSTIAPGPPTRPWYRLANGLRRTIQRGAESLGDERSPLYMGLVVGDDRGQSELLQFRFGASGLTHLLAVSGQNVAFLLSVAAPLLTRMGTRSKLLAAAGLLVMFTLVTRGEPSVMRAVVMAGVAMGAITTGRVASGTRVLSLTVILLVLVDPLLVHSVGFQLSVCATAGLLVLARPIEQRLPGPEFLRLPLAVTFAAQIATAPILLGLAHGLPAAATPANLLAVPPAGLVMMLGVTAGVLAGLIREPFAGVLMWPADLLVCWVDMIATVCSRLPLGVLGATEVVVVAAAVGLILSRPTGRWRHRVTTLGVACLILVCWPSAPSGGPTELTEGATLWVGACGGRVLVLSSGAKVDRVMDALWIHEVRDIDVAVVDGGRAVMRVVAPVREQFDIRRVLSTTDADVPSTDRLGQAGVQVGDLVVRMGAPDGARRHGASSAEATVVRVGSIGGECKF